MPPEPDDRRSDASPPHSPVSIQEGLPVAWGDYQVTELLGIGVHGNVYKAIEAATGRAVQVRLLGPGTVEERQQLEREAARLRATPHPNLINFLDAGATPSHVLYAVTEFVEGPVLASLWTMSQGRVQELLAALTMFQKVCDAVQIAHAQNFYHGQLCPSAVLLDASGEPRLDLIDATLGHILGRQPQFTTGQPQGRGVYASPEQLLGVVESIDQTSDIYALGVILHQILTDGRYPFDADEIQTRNLPELLSPSRISLARLVGRRLTAKLQAPEVKTRWAPVATLEAIVLTCLTGGTHRYPSAGELGQDIARFLSGKQVQAPAAPRQNWLGSIMSRIVPRWLLAGAWGFSNPLATYYWQAIAPADQAALAKLYDSLASWSSLPSWEKLTPEERALVGVTVFQAVRKTVRRSRPPDLSRHLDSRTLAAIERLPALLERLIEVLSQPPANPPPPKLGFGGRDDGDELRHLWHVLAVEQKEILNVVWKHGERVLNYKLIAANLSIPRLVGDDRSEFMSDRSVAKHCRPLEQPPLELLRRFGPRGGIQLTSRGERLVRFHKSNFS